MGSICGDEQIPWDVASRSQEEKIFVAVRLRPLNDREISKNDISDWECINSNTIIFKNSIAERSMCPTAYTFDRVFGCDCSTKQVYEEGAKEVALSVVSGINSTIFAYGQTSSGKTYTMSGITEHTVSDIFEYIDRHNDREFVLKFSAMEIYNEAVRDLLSADSTPLRLLDDPERGTIVEKLTEETLRDWSHLNELISVCEAQRQTGETTLNEMSSRSHQILRLAVESSARELIGIENSSTLTATVNFVDLAGSERASQTLSAGARLKEGCHINRSLLTLGTVIRKLSKGRNAHIPYRDSKLTRILQNSLGGNARTAIICTICPAHSHVEQSRNTLLFASCAKEVSTNAQVNLLMSDKALVKQLQRELARLEGELKSLVSMSSMPNSAALLKEKELLIEKMDKEIKELKYQRDYAESRVRDLLQLVDECQVSRPLAEHDRRLETILQNAWIDEYSASESSEVLDPLRSEVASNTSLLSDRFNNGLISNKHDFLLPDQSDDQFLSDDTSPRMVIDKLFGPDPSRGWEMAVQKHDEDSEDQCKEVRCIEIKESSIDRNAKPGQILSALKGNRDMSHIHMDPIYRTLQEKIKDMQKTIESLVNQGQSPSSSEADVLGYRNMKISRSRSCTEILMPITLSPWFEKAEQNENTPPNGFEKDLRPESGYQSKLSGLKYVVEVGKLDGKDSKISDKNPSLDKKKHKINILGEDDGSGIHNCANELNALANSKYEQQFGDDLVQETKPKTDESGEFVKDKNGLELMPQEGSQLSSSPSNWPMEFEMQQRKIIELWDACNAPLIHRSHFFLLFKGDPSDSIYMEVELRQLSFLKSGLSQGTKALSIRALNRERRMLGKQIHKKVPSVKEKERLYQKWGINLNTKQRSQQLAQRLWTDPKDMNHVRDSAVLVAKLIGFAELGQTPKEMFGLSFSSHHHHPPIMTHRTRSLNPKRSMSSLGY